MAKKRPYTTYYSDGTKGHATTAPRAAIRAVKAVLNGVRHAQVFDHMNRDIVEVIGNRRLVTIQIRRPRLLK